MRRVGLEDAPFIVELYNEKAFKQYIGDRGLRSSEDGAAFIESTLAKAYLQPGYGLFLVESRQAATPMGICGILKRDTLDRPDLGFAFLERFCGKGHAGEAARACIAYAKQQLKLHELAAITSPDNARSIRFLEKLGFAFEKELDHDEYHGGGKLFSLVL